MIQNIHNNCTKKAGVRHPGLKENTALPLAGECLLQVGNHLFLAAHHTRQKDCPAF